MKILVQLLTLVNYQDKRLNSFVLVKMHWRHWALCVCVLTMYLWFSHHGCYLFNTGFLVNKQLDKHMKQLHNSHRIYLFSVYKMMKQPDRIFETTLISAPFSLKGRRGSVCVHLCTLCPHSHNHPIWHSKPWSGALSMCRNFIWSLWNTILLILLTDT